MDENMTMDEMTELQEKKDKIVKEILGRVGTDMSLAFNVINALKDAFNITPNGFSEEDILECLTDEKYEGIDFSDEERDSLVKSVMMTRFWEREIGEMSIEDGNYELSATVERTLTELDMLRVV